MTVYILFNSISYLYGVESSVIVINIVLAKNCLKGTQRCIVFIRRQHAVDKSCTFAYCVNSQLSYIGK